MFEYLSTKYSLESREIDRGVVRVCCCCMCGAARSVHQPRKIQIRLIRDHSKPDKTRQNDKKAKEKLKILNHEIFRISLALAFSHCSIASTCYIAVPPYPKVHN